MAWLLTTKKSLRDAAKLLFARRGLLIPRRMHRGNRSGSGSFRSPQALICPPGRKLREACEDAIGELQDHWAAPKYWAEVEYRDITTDGLLRHVTFRRLYASKDAPKCLWCEIQTIMGFADAPERWGRLKQCIRLGRRQLFG
jgi:hypothetical protein